MLLSLSPTSMLGQEICASRGINPMLFGPRRLTTVRGRRYDGPYPPCFDSIESWSLWRSAARETHFIGSVRTPSYCKDCTPSYVLKMRSEGRCTNPDIKFVWRTMATDSNERCMVGDNDSGLSPENALKLLSDWNGKTRPLW